MGDSLRIAPVIPPDWDGFEIRYQFGETVYLIEVCNPEHVARNMCHILLDGMALNGSSIPLVNDKQQHRVVVTMGNNQ